MIIFCEQMIQVVMVSCGNLLFNSWDSCVNKFCQMAKVKFWCRILINSSLVTLILQLGISIKLENCSFIFDKINDDSTC